MPLHIYTAAAKRNALRFEAKPLFNGRIAPQFNLAARAENALPGKPERTMKRASNLASATGKSRGTGDGAVGRNLAARNLANCRLNRFPGV